MESEEADRPPPHPDQLFDITLTCHQLPPGPHRALQEQLGQAIRQASEVFTLMGLDADQSLNCARETAWTMIDMKPVVASTGQSARSSSKTAGPHSSSSTGWY